MMYIGIFKLLLKKRFYLKINSTIQLLKKINIHIADAKKALIIVMSFKALFAIAFGIGMSLLVEEKYLDCTVSLAILLGAVSRFMGGGLDYKYTHIFPFEELKKLSIAKDTKIYHTQLAGTLIYNLYKDDFFWSVLVYLICGVLRYQLNIMAVVMFALSCLMGFLIGNLIIGKYIYEIRCKKISILRFSVYIGGVALAIFLVCKVLNFGFTFAERHVAGKFNDWEQLLDDAYLEQEFDAMGQSILSYFSDWIQRLSELRSQLVSAEALLVCALLIAASLLVKVDLMPIGANIKPFEGRDGLSLLVRLFHISGRRGGLILKDQIERLKEFRWLISKPFFQLVFMNYESVVYLALFSLLAYRVGNPVLALQMILCMNMMVLVCQCMDLRCSAYIYFSPTLDVNKIRLLKLSPAKEDTLWRSKEFVFRMFMFLPSLITIAYSLVLAICMSLPWWHFLAIAVVWLGCIVMMPLIQLHMIPLVCNLEAIDINQIGEDFLEDDVANKMQEFPRMFLIIVPLMITLGMLFVGALRSYYLLAIELVYWFVAFGFLYVYLKRIRKKGVERLLDRVF
ncbi:MAG: hypothetical protein IKS21_04490 [Oscillospiraceae bacterium]|nr:hypothetical protein [Oscillospiraceae bacterium]